MASPADAYKAIAYAARAIPGQLGLRPHTVSILVGTWSGSFAGRGGTLDEEFPITEAGGQPPKVRDLNTEELALGNLGSGSIKIGPITPSFAGGGTALDIIRPAVTAGQTVHLWVVGPSYPLGARFLIKDLQTDHALHYTIVASPVENGLP